MRDLDLDVATSFLLIAATLVELKARRLLPNMVDIDLDEEFALWEERDLLLARLLEAKTFKDVATVFARLAEDADCSFPRLVGPDDRFADVMPDMLEGTSLTRLRNAAISALTPRPVPDGRSVPRRPDHHHRRRRRRRTDRRTAAGGHASRSAGSPVISSTASR